MVMFDSNDDAQSDDRSVAVSAGIVRPRRWSAAKKAAIIKETLVPGARISDVARRWQVDPQQVYRWRHSEGVTHHHRPMRRSQPATPDFVPIVTDARPAEAAAPATLANPVIEVSLAGAVVRVVSGLDDAPLTAVLRAVRASALRP
jgi:transposase